MIFRNTNILSIYIRIISLVGIIMLLILQFLWFKNAYEMIEKEIIEKCKSNLEEAIDKELFKRLSNTITISNKPEMDKSFQMISDVSINEHEEINNNLQEIAYNSGIKCSIEKVDSFFSDLNKKNIGYALDYKILLKADTINSEQGQLDFKTVLSKKGDIISKRINKFEVIDVHLNITTNILFKAKNLFITSLLIVLVICSILIYQLITVLNEFKFIKFIREYASSVTHDLASPIGSITMTLDLLNSGKFDHDKKVKKEYYELCIDEGNKHQRKIRRFITVSNAGLSRFSVEKEIVNLYDFFTSIINYFNMSTVYSEKKVNFCIDEKNLNINAYIDIDLFDSVIINIIENSIKYSIEDVTITINCHNNKNDTVINIKDNGIGIGSEDLEYIFDYFKRGKFKNIDKVFGYGIGLSFAKKIVDAHKGKIEVKSEINKGVEFIISIPNYCQL